MDLFTRDLTIRDDNTTRFTFGRTTGNFTANGDVTATNFLVGGLNVNEHAEQAYTHANAAFDAANTIDTFNQTLNTSDVVTFDTLESTNIANTIITGNLEINVANISISGNLIPSQNITYNIGSPDKRFHSVYVGPGSVDIGGIILSNNNGQLSVSGASQVSIGDTPLANADYFPIFRDFGFLEELNSSFGLGNDTFVFEVEAYDCREDPVRTFGIPLITKDFGHLT
jgi:hypothetical protein